MRRSFVLHKASLECQTAVSDRCRNVPDRALPGSKCLIVSAGLRRWSSIIPVQAVWARTKTSSRESENHVSRETADRHTLVVQTRIQKGDS